MYWKLTQFYSVHEVFGKTGEPIEEGVKTIFGAKPTEQYNASRIAAVNVAKREFQKEYMEYWNSTVAKTGTGRPVDAVVAPLAPFPAAIKDTYEYYGEQKPLIIQETDSMKRNKRLTYTSSIFGVC